jgi:methionine synthase I (cobalamin-dependent)
MALNLKSFSGTCRVTDGVYGTEFQKMGLLGGCCSESLNLVKPEAVQAVARSYVMAGSDVVMTNTLLAHRFGLAPYGLAGRTTEIAQAAAEIACRATEGTQIKVFGSFGPTGKIVMMRETSEDEIASAFAETTRALAAGGAQAIVLETFNELAEARIALAAAKSVCDLPVILSMAFAFGPDKCATMMGESPEDLVKMANENGADAVGGNCGVGPEEAVRVVERLHAATQLPVWTKPNAGLPVVKEGRAVFPMNPSEFAAFAPDLRRAGASFIGGCCGAGPDHIRAVRRALTA